MSHVSFKRSMDQKTLEALEEAKKQGVNVYDVDVRAFADKVAPMLQQIDNSRFRASCKELMRVN